MTLEKVVRRGKVKNKVTQKDVDSIHPNESLSDVIDLGIRYLKKHHDEYDSYTFDIRIYDLNSKIYSDADLNSKEFYDELMSELDRVNNTEDRFKVILNHIKWLELSINLEGEIVWMSLRSPVIISPFCEGLVGGQFQYDIGDMVRLRFGDGLSDEKYEIIGLPSTYWERYHPLGGDYGYKMKNIETGEIIDQDECYLDYSLYKVTE